MEDEKSKEVEETKKEEDEKKESKSDLKSSRKRRRSRSRKRSRSKGRRSRSRHKSPKRKRSPSSRKRRSKSRDRGHRRSRSRERRRKRSREKKGKSSRSERKRGRSISSSGGTSDEDVKAEIKKTETTNGNADVENAEVEKKKDDNQKVDEDKKKSKTSDSKSEKGKTRKRSRSRSSHRRHRPRRSKSRERRRSRDRARRSRSHGRRSRSRKRSKSRDRKRDGDSKATTDNDAERRTASKFSDVNPLSKDFEQAKLEDEMKKRRERVEKWRSEQKPGGGEEEAEEDQAKENSLKFWSLEDDDEDDDENAEKKEGGEEGGEDEIDPLDAFMLDLNKDKQQSSEKQENKDGGNKGPKVSQVIGVANKSKALKKKGELMEENMDAMEYSSEEEEESLDSAFSKFRTKQQPKKLEATVDHSKIDYEPFRKNFYVEVPELASMTTEEVETMRYNMENIKIRGKNCPKPIQSWVQAGVSYKMLSSLKKAKYDKPTIIQAQAIPAIMAGNDVIGIAKTGSGKTVAFLLPMFRQIMDQRPLEATEGPIGLILSPTRELALQITKECKKFSKALKLRVVCVYGGTGISEQIAELKRGAEIIVCTPGRMIDMLTVNSGRVTNLRRCTYLVLDEADRMFDMGFEPQVMHIIKSCRPDRQTVLFSATFPRQMEALARRILNKPVEVQVGGRSVVCSDVVQEVVILNEEQKYLKLLELLGEFQEQGSVLVFVDKQEHADHLLKDLMGSNYPCMALHGGIDQYDRDSVITDFKNRVNPLLIATSVAARGLDVRSLILVVNYGCPNHYEDYVHRCGRTGRAGNKGWAYTFITDNQARYSGEIIKALELSGTLVPKNLEELWSKFKAEQVALGKAVKSNSGFSGRGFKFDEVEHTMAKERKQLQKAALGLQDSDDDEDSQDIDEKIESMFNSKKSVKDIAGPLVNSGSSVGQVVVNQAKLDVAKRLANKINMQKNLGAGQDVMQKAAKALMKGGVFQAPKVSAKTIAEQVAEKIHQKLNYIPQEKPEEDEDDEEKGDLKRYEEELEINDFPQTCRWKVTSKDMLIQISDYSEAGITIRGQYYPPGKQPGEDERKLYLSIEAISELAVQKAKNEVTRLIKEELIRLQNSYQPINKGRYKVM